MKLKPSSIKSLLLPSSSTFSRRHRIRRLVPLFLLPGVFLTVRLHLLPSSLLYSLSLRLLPITIILFFFFYFFSSLPLHSNIFPIPFLPLPATSFLFSLSQVNPSGLGLRTIYNYVRLRAILEKHEDRVAEGRYPPLPFLEDMDDALSDSDSPAVEVRGPAMKQRLKWREIDEFKVDWTPLAKKRVIECHGIAHSFAYLPIFIFCFNRVLYTRIVWSVMVDKA